MIQSLWEIAWQFLTKLNIELPYNTATPLLGEPRTLSLHKNLYTSAHPALFIIAKKWKQPKRPLTDEQINKMCYIHTMDSHCINTV